MSCIFDGFYENRSIMSRRPLEEPKAKELPRLNEVSKIVKGGDVKIEKVDPTERLKKAIQKEIKIKPKKEPPVRMRREDIFISNQPTKLDAVIKNLINDAEDKTIDKLFNIIIDKLEGEDLIIKNIRNKRKFIINLL